MNESILLLRDIWVRFVKLLRKTISIKWNSYKTWKGSNRWFKPFWGSSGFFSDWSNSIAHIGLHGATGAVNRLSLRRSSASCQVGSRWWTYPALKSRICQWCTRWACLTVPFVHRRGFLLTNPRVGLRGLSASGIPARLKCSFRRVISVHNISLVWYSCCLVHLTFRNNKYHRRRHKSS